MTDAKCTEAMKAESRKYFGKNDIDEKGVAILQEMIVSTGAKAALETMIEDLTSKALRAIENPAIDSAGRDLLNELALIATKRSM
jgi:geranylgeranyl diphosphate synthase type I